VAKVRWLVATLFYNTRVITDTDFDSLFKYLVPTEPSLINIETERINVRRYIAEVRSDVCQSHERLARAWLDGPCGQEFIASQELARFVTLTSFNNQLATG
jgi:hypothetical protein